MKSFFRSLPRAAIFFLASAAVAIPNASKEVSTPSQDTKSSFFEMHNIGSDGAYRTSVDIKVPEFRDLEPKLALSYNSSDKSRSRAEAFTGLGWRLRGLSMIERRSASGGAPTYTKEQDIFVLDGEELLSCSTFFNNYADWAYPNKYRANGTSSSCEAGGNMTTLRDRHVKIVRLQNDNARNSEFHIFGKDGTRYRYQSAGELAGVSGSAGSADFDTTARRIWLLTEIQDVQATPNMVSISYDFNNASNGRIHRPRTIAYGEYRVFFNYSEPSAPLASFATGKGIARQTHRLDSIVIRDLLPVSKIVRAYKLTYAQQTALTKSSLLTGIQEFGSNAVITGAQVTGGTSLPPHTFTYRGDDLDYTAVTTGRSGFHTALAVADTNNKGREDVLFFPYEATNGLAEGDPDYYGLKLDPRRYTASETNSLANASVTLPSLKSINLHFTPRQPGNSSTTLIGITRPHSGFSDSRFILTLSETWTYPTSDHDTSLGEFKVEMKRINSNGTISSEIIPALIVSQEDWNRCNPAFAGTKGPVGLGNFDNDQDSELILFDKLYKINNVGGVPTLQHMSGRRGDLSSLCERSAPKEGYSLTYLIGDFNGNGTHDILVGKDRYRLTGSSFVRTVDSSSPLPGPGYYDYGDYTEDTFSNTDFLAGDINGDGIDDIVTIFRGSSTTRKVDGYLSTGAAFQPRQVWLSAGDMPNLKTVNRGDARNMLADLNGDGLADLIMHNGFSSATVVGGNYTQLQPLSAHIRISDGKSFGKFTNGYPYQPGGLGYIPAFLGIADMNGDGRPDLIMQKRQESDGNLPDAIGFASTATYAPNLMSKERTPTGSEKSIVYSPSTRFANGELPFVTQVVTSLSMTDGRGQTRTTNFTYVNGKYDYTYRKPLGFKTVRAVLPPIDGETSGPELVRIYENDSAANQGLLVSETYFHGSTTYSRKINTWSVTTQRPFRRFKTSERTAELYGTQLIETARDFSYTTYGERQKVIEYGFSNNGSNRSAHDDVVTDLAFSTNPAKYIVNTPSIKRVQRGTVTNWDRTTFLEYETYHYDGASNENTAPVRGNLTEIKRWQGNVNNNGRRTERRMEYDAYGNLIKEWDARNAETLHAYDTLRNLYRVQTTNAMGHLTAWTWNTLCQSIETEKNTNNQTTRYTYDALCRETERLFPLELGNANRTYTRTSYHNIGTPTTQYTSRKERSASDVSGSREAEEQEYFDGFGQVWKTVRSGTTSALTTDAVDGTVGELRAYDARGNLRWKSVPLSLTEANAGVGSARRTMFDYDPFNRQIRQSYADNSKSEQEYVVLAFNDIGTSMPYPGVRSRDAHCFDADATTLCGDLAVFHDHAGRSVRHLRYNNNTAAETTRFIFDHLGRMTTIHDPQGARWDYTYDVYGNRITAADPGLGEWTMSYDAGGNLTRQYDGAGKRIDFAYDALNRVTLKTVGTGGGRVETHFTYDQPRTGYLNIGFETTQEVWRAGTSGELVHKVERDYEFHGHIAREVHAFDGRSYTLSNIYWPSGALRRQNLPARPGTSPTYMNVGDYLYDASSRLISVGSQISAISYNVWDKPTRVDYGSGAYETTSYDGRRGWVSQIRGQSPTGALQMRSLYTRSATGRISVHLTATPADHFAYTYDYAGRLLTVANQASRPQHDLVMSYDTAGRMLSKGQSSATATTYQYNSSRPVHAPRRIVTSGVPTIFSYDATGNMLVGVDSKAMTYDGENRPLSVTLNGNRTCYVYGADGKRLKKIEGLTSSQSCTATLPANARVTAYIGPVELRNFAASSGEELILHPHQRFRLAANSNAAPVANHFFLDALGTVRVAMDASGARVENHSYTPWGEKTPGIVPTQTMPETKGWIGERYDEDAGLQYLNARYYDPKLGLFIQPDWFDVTKRGVGTNRYSYSFNDPINKIDPNGNATYVEPDGDTERDDDFTVKSVEENDDLNIYVIDDDVEKENWNVIGQTRFWDSFVSPDTGKYVGKVYSGVSFDGKFSELAKKAGSMSSISVAFSSLPGRQFDVKSTTDSYTPYSGMLFDGKYMTLREIGNVLAGFNAAGKGKSFQEFQVISGALHVGGPLGAIQAELFGRTYGSAPNYGEVDYQRTRSEYGYGLSRSIISGQDEGR